MPGVPSRHPVQFKAVDPKITHCRQTPPSSLKLADVTAEVLQPQSPGSLTPPPRVRLKPGLFGSWYLHIREGKVL